MDTNAAIKKIVEDNCHSVEGKKQQTTYKIKYVKSYVEKWLYVIANSSADKISFIDCMCNAGVYTDGELGTSIEVLKLFAKFAYKNPNKRFYLFLNDYDAARTEIIKQVIDAIIPTQPKNLIIDITYKDVNQYLKDVHFFKNRLSYGTILFVDPYDFGTVQLEAIKVFTKEYYCELLWNVFTSDFVRNINNDVNSARFIRCLGEDIKLCNTPEDVMGYIRKCLICGNIKHSFSYVFKTMTNRELYQIMYFTPKLRGLEKLKEALWEVFSGKEFHRNHVDNSNQISLFSEEDDEMMYINEYKSDIQKKLIDYLSQNKHEFLFDEIETFVLENSMLQKGHVIRYVIKPLISEGILIKHNLKSKKEYTHDKYTFKEERA